MDALQKEDETLEDLQLNGLKILQKTSGFRFGMDSVLLADFAQVRPTDHVADFGTGTGILPLLLIGRGRGPYESMDWKTVFILFTETQGLPLIICRPAAWTASFAIRPMV